MTASERMTNILSVTPEDKINSSLFWSEQIEKHLGSSNANDIEDFKLSEAFFFMYISAKLIEEIESTTPTPNTWSIFDDHVRLWNEVSIVKLKKVYKKST